MKVKDFQEFINSKSWTFAKSYAETSPHEYTVCNVLDKDREEFEKAVLFIRSNGKTEYYYEHPFTVFKIDGRKYWTMGEPMEATILINRTLHGQQDKTYGEQKPSK